MAVAETTNELARIAVNKRGDYIIVQEIVKGDVKQIDVRKWYTNDNDEICPSTKGVRLSLADFLTVTEVVISNEAPQSKTAAKAATKKAPVKKAAAPRKAVAARK